ncbi:HAMP domain-containing sensor histidine kinase [Streptomyces coeruleoprunus]|uniref:histidine kinase n=1 Tax=Streptomyces coeruleoprunus TaxID=285563 RepID=A0ABV9XEL0_9ACTN
MQIRLLFTYLSLTALILLMLGIPLALSYALNEYHHMVTVRHQAVQDVAKDAGPVLSGESGESGENLEDRVRLYDLQNDTAIVVVDRAGKVVLTSRDDVRHARATLDPLLGRATKGEGTGMSHRMTHTLRPDPVAFAEPVYRGETVVGAVGAVAYTAALRKDVNDHVIILVGVAALALTAVALAGIPLSRWLLHPIERLDRTAQAIADGAYDVRARCTSGPPEIRRLSRAFDGMADRLVTLLNAQRSFVADASHQMRNPLTALRLRVEALETAIRPEGERQLEQAVAEAERLSAILDQMLRLARAEGVDRPAEPVDVAAVVAGRLAAWGEVAARKGVELAALEGDGAVCAAVPGHLEQILDVFVDNALHVSGKGDRVVVRYEAGEDAVRVHVVDQGPGMSPEECRRALDRFWRGSNSAARDGSGLGLAIAHALAESNCGSLRLDPAATGPGVDAQVILPRWSRPA